MLGVAEIRSRNLAGLEVRLKYAVFWRDLMAHLEASGDAA